MNVVTANRSNNIFFILLYTGRKTEVCIWNAPIPNRFPLESHQERGK